MANGHFRCGLLPESIIETENALCILLKLRIPISGNFTTAITTVFVVQKACFYYIITAVAAVVKYFRTGESKKGPAEVPHCPLAHTYRSSKLEIYK